MADLDQNASVGAIEEEMDFKQAMIYSLDAGADDYESRRQELQEEMNELQQRLAQAHALPPSHNPPPMSTTDPKSPDFSSSTAGTNNTKRPAPGLCPDLLDRPSKRQTPSPLPSNGASSSSDAQDRARLRQMMAEAAIKRQQEDAKYAQRLSQQWASGSAVAGPSSQPVYQARLEANGRILPSIRGLLDETRSPTPQNLSGQALSPGVSRIKSEHSKPQSLPHRIREAAELVDLTGDSDDDRTTVPAHASHSSLPNGYPGVSSLSGRIGGPSSAAAGPGCPSPYVQQSGLQQMTPSQHGMPVHQRHQMPGTYPGPSLPTSYMTPAECARRGIPYGSPVQPSPLNAGRDSLTMDYFRRVQAASSSTFNAIQAVNGHSGSNYQQLRNLLSGSQSNPHYLDDDYDDDDDEDDFMYMGSRFRPQPRQDPYANHEDLFRSRYEQLEQYNPEKTKEEINALLLNIRPDEDLPDHLLIQTPEAMTIKLHKYQELGLTWLQKSEEGSNKGGILADDMGLGKTIQMIALIVTRKSEDPRCKTTLIVAPVALLRQWKQEIEQKVKHGRHALTVYIHHGATKKSHFRDLQVYDVVLTTFGSLAAELKRLEKFNLRKQHDAQARPRKDEQCTLIDPDCNWYRVILDEAQCIKNKTTQTAKAAFMLKATYRFCMTGTPMMNNVGELYSLINFLRIKPYCSWEKFRLDFVLPLKAANELNRGNAMKMLQALCRATMLRRTKKSEYQGKPILILPERSTDIEHATFDDDEEDLYTKLEQRTQITFNKYLRAGTVGRSYSAILVLLLRLRQACCHPHLIKDFSIGAAADLSDEALLNLARELDQSVVTRIKATEGNFECPICMDACINPAIFLPCGHDTCRDCYVKLADPAQALREGQENGKARCPHCRGDIDPKRITDFTSFKHIHMPELLTEEEKTQYGLVNEDDSEPETESESSESEDESEDKTLNGFIVKDDAEDSETESEAEEGDIDDEVDMLQGPSKKKGKEPAKKSKKIKKSKKGKGKEKVKHQLTLAELKKAANSNVKARKKYLRRLREDYKDSAKIRKMMELLREIINGPEDAEEDYDAAMEAETKPKVKDSGEKVLIFSQWTSLLDLCEVEIDRKGWGYRRYDGSMSAKMRADAVDDFKSTSHDIRIMLVSLKAGNAGLNLNVANQVIILDPFWNPYIEEQAIDRAHRIGQTRPVKVHRVLVKATVEDRILALQDSKRKLIEQALDEQQASQLSRLGARELAYLFGVTRNITDNVEYREAGR